MTGRPFILNSDKIHIITLYSPPASTASNVKFRGEFLELKMKSKILRQKSVSSYGFRTYCLLSGIEFLESLNKRDSTLRKYSNTT